MEETEKYIEIEKILKSLGKGGKVTKKSKSYKKTKRSKWVSRFAGE